MNAVTLHARRQGGFEQRLQATTQALRQAAFEHAGAIVQATSLGAEDMVITDLIARHQLGIAVATLDTGALHDETLALVDVIDAHYGLRVERWAPTTEAVLHFVQDHGERAMFESQALRKSCCALRKLEPLGRLLHGRSAWLTGLRREQSDARADVPQVDTSDPARIKFNPLAAWSLQDVWHYIAMHQVPYNPLHDAFYPSIGCAPCTRAVAVGEDPRAGRWWWEQDSAKECGLHVHDTHEGATA